MSEQLDAYSFKIDDCLPVALRAPSESAARRRLGYSYPRTTKIELIGVNTEMGLRTLGMLSGPEPIRSKDMPVEHESFRPVTHAPKGKPVTESIGGYADAINEAIAGDAQ